MLVVSYLNKICLTLQRAEDVKKRMNGFGVSPNSNTIVHSESDSHHFL